MHGPVQLLAELFSCQGTDLAMQGSDGGTAQLLVLLLIQPGGLPQGEGLEAEDREVAEGVRVMFGQRQYLE
jgi:hypothetical protein